MDSNTQKTRRSGRQTKKSFKVRENDALAPILLEALPPDAQPLLNNGIPQFEPHSCVPFESMRPRVPICSPLQLFLLLLREETLQQIVTATNTYTSLSMQATAEFRRPRPWHPLTQNKLII